MNRQPVFQSQVPAGCEMYGSPKPGQDVSSILPNYIQSNTELAPPTGVEYVPPIPTCIHWNEMKQVRCKGPKAKGTDYCIGHLNQQAKEAKKSKE
jgi:hypothetical protein